MHCITLLSLNILWEMRVCSLFFVYSNTNREHQTGQYFGFTIDQSHLEILPAHTLTLERNSHISMKHSAHEAAQETLVAQ